MLSLTLTLTLQLGPPAVAATPITWSTTGSAYTKADHVYELACPGNGSLSAYAYGTDVYTADTGVCKAAAHLGVITMAEGGVVKLKPVGRQSSFPGSTRNNVKTASYPSSYPAYTFVVESKEAEVGTTIGGLWRLPSGATVQVPAEADGAAFDVVFTSMDGRDVLTRRASWTEGMKGVEFQSELEGEIIIATFNPANPKQLRLKSPFGDQAMADRIPQPTP